MELLADMSGHYHIISIACERDSNKAEKLTKTFMMITNLKKNFGLHGLCKYN